MITNIGMKYKLHQVLFNHQISPNRPLLVCHCSRLPI